MVAAVVLTWEGDHRFDAEDRDAMPVDIDGEATMGVRPSDLLPMALAGCSGVDVVNQIGADRLTSLEITVHYTKEPDPPWRFQRFRLHYRAAGPDLTEQELTESVHRSHDEMCSVSHAIRGNVPVETTVEVSRQLTADS
jgi:putative redox protein